MDAVSYDAKTRIVSVTFPSGATYEYNNISLEMLKQWAYAVSIL
ncbi:MAG: KTSC domain-containing protein [Chitinispirillales bacterium]|nr:KTSC domain-containing protein [Chitinispirillales bacterium]